MAYTPDPVWEEWFDVQYQLTLDVRDMIKERTKGKSDTFKAAVCSGIMESIAEDIRMYLHLPETDLKKEEEEEDEQSGTSQVSPGDTAS